MSLRISVFLLSATLAFAKGPVGLQVLDEEAFLNGRKEAVTSAIVHWISESSNMKARVDGKGEAPLLYPKTISAKFIVTAPGYLPAFGYALDGKLTPVLLYSTSRIPSILSSLNPQSDPSKSLVIGRFLDSNLHPVAGRKINSQADLPFRSYYSIGGWGLFHPKAKQTGPQGDFLLSGVDRTSFQYLFTENKAGESASWLMDFRNLPAIFSITLLEPTQHEKTLSVLDAFESVPVESFSVLSIAGQKNVVPSRELGTLKLPEIFNRNSVDLFSIKTRGYLESWLNTGWNFQSFPNFFTVFSENQVRNIFAEAPEFSFSSDRSYLFGHLRSEDFKQSKRIYVFDESGKRVPEAKVFYFDQENRIHLGARATHPFSQNFVVVGLDDGEYHVVVANARKRYGEAIQITRVQKGIVSLIQF